MSTANSHRFFSNRDCRYFPCHRLPDGTDFSDDFNCMFCFCPFYLLGDECEGNHFVSETSGLKNCKNCHLPHLPEFYDKVIAYMKSKKESVVRT